MRYGIGMPEHDLEGRVVTWEYQDFFVVSVQQIRKLYYIFQISKLIVYVPNSMDYLRRLEYRVFEWDVAFREYWKSLREQKYVVIAGDMNVAHEPIDLFNPKPNEWSAGFTFYERSSLTQLLNSGFVDSFREIYPDRVKYSWWSNRWKQKLVNGILSKVCIFTYYLINNYILLMNDV